MTIFLSVLTPPLVSFIIILAWEHIGKVTNATWKPTYILQKITNVISKVSYWIGCRLAIASSCLELCWRYIKRIFRLLRLNELWGTTMDIMKALWSLSSASREWLYGYYETVSHYKWNKTLTNVGLALLNVGFTYIVYKILAVYFGHELSFFIVLIYTACRVVYHFCYDMISKMISSCMRWEQKMQKEVEDME